MPAAASGSLSMSFCWLRETLVTLVGVFAVPVPWTLNPITPELCKRIAEVCSGSESVHGFKNSAAGSVSAVACR